LPNIGNIINVSRIYINVARQSKLRGSRRQDDECNIKKNENGSSSMNSLDKETQLLRRKLEEEKARKRTRGPYRKSHLN
jgi:hypothetical protein